MLYLHTKKKSVNDVMMFTFHIINFLNFDAFCYYYNNALSIITVKQPIYLKYSCVTLLLHNVTYVRSFTIVRDTFIYRC